ncbi:hypothetical protein OUZ56_000669 [Daphnia magna]|uniref:Uncharacterized protein n=1 Tax=Daphnia magna TaxID=35525 RepID=A0ABR0A0F7_9CRUS|nr:hypothetical protein OUZ56_000669 [Daphnia magna]
MILNGGHFSLRCRFLCESVAIPAHFEEYLVTAARALAKKKCPSPLPNCNRCVYMETSSRDIELTQPNVPQYSCWSQRENRLSYRSRLADRSVSQFSIF